MSNRLRVQKSSTVWTILSEGFAYRDFGYPNVQTPVTSPSPLRFYLIFVNLKQKVGYWKGKMGSRSKTRDPLLQTHYEILGLQPNCSPKQIREAFVSISKKVK